MRSARRAEKELTAVSYTIDLLIPTARFVFAVESETIEVLPEFRSPVAASAYADFRRQHPVTGMTTFPNTLLLRGPKTIVVDPGLHLQNEPVLRALETRGVVPDEVDLVVLTHAHLDHAGACVDLAAPVAVHERECAAPHWPTVSGVLERRQLVLLSGDEGEVAPGIRWAHTPGHTDGGVSYCVPTAAGPVVICGDIVGPQRADFDAMRVPADESESTTLLRSWVRLRAWSPELVVAGHLPPFHP